MEQRSTKQVIVIRRDIKMRRGKEISQGCHASMGALLSCVVTISNSGDNYTDRRLRVAKDGPIAHWLDNSFTKITVTVETATELVDLYDKAQTAGLPNALIKDNGKTEFHGVPTYTALAIGPWWSDEIDLITGQLPLY